MSQQGPALVALRPRPCGDAAELGSLVWPPSPGLALWHSTVGCCVLCQDPIGLSQLLC